MTRINGIADSGLFSFAFAFAIIMFTIGSYSGRAYQVSDYKNSFSTNAYIKLRLLTAFSTIAITAAFVLLNGYDLHKSILIFLLVGHRVFDAIADVFYGIMQKKRHLYISGKSLFFKSLLSFVAFFAIDLLTHNLLLAALSLPICSILFLMFYDIPQSSKLESLTTKLKSTEIKQILKSTFLPFAVAVMGLIFVNLARYFIDIYHPNLQGYFGIIIMPLSLVVLLFSFISTPAILHLSNLFNDEEFRALNRSIGKIIAIVLAATLLLCTLTFLFGVPLLKLLFNLDFSNYIFDIILVILIGMTISLASLFTSIAVIARRLRVTAGVYLLSNVLLSVLCMLLINQYEIRGGIIAYVSASATQALFMYVYYLHLTGSYRFSKKS